ncbi:hypothetical protein DQ04_02751120 [Trypanosoma grayi]|uniref:hypothetical protein n=1 Tax=Trypanosoma grayi TaxID=71804 RepID=UPI0004F467C1|nr:hypothetical protein DQ04_02751120 [Trypanosoma grayi]KEG11314.1 hypothetical protein DQ04_02751120 [Trypanosoma grayi]
MYGGRGCVRTTLLGEEAADTTTKKTVLKSPHPPNMSCLCVAFQQNNTRPNSKPQKERHEQHSAPLRLSLPPNLCTSSHTFASPPPTRLLSRVHLCGVLGIAGEAHYHAASPPSRARHRVSTPSPSTFHHK